MDRPDLEEMCGGVARILQQAIKEDRFGERVGFCLLMFDFGEEGSFAYAANAQRADVVRLLKEAREKIGAEAQ
jgi:hypothetical protein